MKSGRGQGAGARGRGAGLQQPQKLWAKGPEGGRQTGRQVATDRGVLRDVARACCRGIEGHQAGRTDPFFVLPPVSQLSLGGESIGIEVAPRSHRHQHVVEHASGTVGFLVANGHKNPALFALAGPDISHINLYRWDGNLHVTWTKLPVNGQASPANC